VCDAVLLTCFVDVRLAGISALIDFQPADGSSEDLEFLLDIAENDPEPKIRHEVIRMLIETPPFELAAGSPVDTPTLASRLWNNIKYVEVVFLKLSLLNFYCCSQNLNYDSKLRCDFVDLYYVLYGMRRPLCYTENFALMKPALKREVTCCFVITSNIKILYSLGRGSS